MENLVMGIDSIDLPYKEDIKKGILTIFHDFPILNKILIHVM